MHVLFYRGKQCIRASIHVVWCCGLLVGLARIAYRVASERKSMEHYMPKDRLYVESASCFSLVPVAAMRFVWCLCVIILRGLDVCCCWRGGGWLGSGRQQKDKV